MITRDNLKDVLLQLEPERVKDAWFSDRDYIAMWCGSYGGAHIVSVITCDPEVEGIDDILSAGGVVCDKDDLARLFEECGLDLDAILYEA